MVKDNAGAGNSIRGPVFDGLIDQTAPTTGSRRNDTHTLAKHGGPSVSFLHRSVTQVMRTAMEPGAGLIAPICSHITFAPISRQRLKANVSQTQDSQALHTRVARSECRYESPMNSFGKPTAYEERG